MGKTIPLVQNMAKAENISNDWLSNFFEKSRLISDSDMQTLWSRIFAGEVNNPGTFSKLTLKIISGLEKKDAELFTLVASATFIIGELTLTIFMDSDPYKNIYDKNCITFVKLAHLEILGLIKFNSLSGFIEQRLPKTFNISYYGIIIRLEMPKNENNNLEIGNVLLT